MDSFPKDEIKRKVFHLLILTYAFGYFYAGKITILCSLAVALVVVSILEFLRLKFIAFNDFFKEKFKGFYRPEEANRVSGLLGTLSGAFLTILVFPDKYIVFASFLYLAFGDALAALIGKTFGRHKIYSGKTLEGSSACFIACFIVGACIFNLKFAFLGAFAAALIESINWKINDNFWIQLVNAGFLSFLTKFIEYSK
ncbi:MAG: hypothetical protein LBU55_02970 [Elusimicrobiota bacterium]|jgi:dolichol kinase|nr:hypothetical protein [Elusimicrobiota bacterium]